MRVATLATRPMGARTRAFSFAWSLLAAVGAAGGGAARANEFDDEVAARRASFDERAGRADAIVVLLGLLDLWADVEDRNAIAALLDAAKDDARQRPEVRARAAFLRALVADRLGDAAGAERLRASVGLLRDWIVLGPFDDEGRAADGKSLPPERDLAAKVDPRVSYAGKEHAVGWRRFPPTRVTQGIVALDAALQPEQHVLGYATTFVRVDKATVAALRLGSTGAMTAWVGADRVHQSDVYRPVRFDQDVAAIRLRAGWNRVTVKLGADESGWAFFARLTRLDGSRLAFDATADLARVAGYRAPPLPKTKAKDAPMPAPSDLLRDLKAAADGGQAAAQRAFGLYLHYVAPEDPKLGAAERLLALAAAATRDVDGWREAALAAGEDEKARRYLEAAILPERGERPARARCLTLLGTLYDRLHREHRAEELWRAALSEDPEHFPASLRLAELAAGRGLPSRAREMLDAVAREHRPISVLRALAEMAERQGRRANAETLYRQLAEATRDDLAPLRQLQLFARQRGDVTAAVALLERMAALRPDLASLIAERAQLLDGVGRSEEAHKVLEAALVDCPDQASLIELDGRVLHRLGRDAEALDRFRRSLELHPQDPDLRAYVIALQAAAPKNAGNDEDLAREWSVPVAEIVARAARASRPAKVPAWALLDRQVTRVHQNGLSQTFSQRVVQILDERGAREQGQAAVRYTPDSQAVEIKAARVYKPSGEVIEAAGQTDQDMSEPWYGLYYDTHAQVIELGHLDPGDVVDFEYVLSDVASRNMFGDYFGEMEMLQEEAPRMESDYVLIAPRSRKLYFNKPSLAGLTFAESEKGDARVYRFHAESVPKIETEPGMPGITSVGAYVHVSTFESWEHVAEWYRGLVREQLEPDDAIRDAVKATLAEAEAKARAEQRALDEREKIGAIYDLVVKSTRYVGLEFGIHGYKPYRVSQVFQRKFGDCKDKASLLVAMLKLARVEASLVLVRTRRGGDIASYPASLAPFDHAIAYVPKYDLFLDGTAEFSGSGELPAQDQDVPVLIVSDPRAGGRGHLVRTPVLPPLRNHVVRALDVALSPAGDAKVTLSMTVEGQAAQEWRSQLQSVGERRERLEKAENATHPGTHVVKVELPSLEDLERSVTMQAEMEVPAWARPLGDKGLTMPALGREGELLRTYARLSERRHDLVLGYPWQHEERVTVALPPGFTPTRLPSPQAIDTAYGRFTLAVERRGQSVQISASLEVRRHRITSAEYPGFRRFCLDVDRAVAQDLVIGRE